MAGYRSPPLRLSQARSYPFQRSDGVRGYLVDELRAVDRDQHLAPRVVVQERRCGGVEELESMGDDGVLVVRAAGIAPPGQDAGHELSPRHLEAQRDLHPGV